MDYRVGLGFPLYIEKYRLVNIIDPQLYMNEHWMILCKGGSYHVDWSPRWLPLEEKI